MKLIIGLGNPGLKYKHTRHNLGFMVVDKLAEKIGLKWKYSANFNAEIIETTLKGKKTILLKPLTYMNLSGQSVVKVVNYYNVDLDDIIVVVDDLALDTGRLRLREFGSDGGHNGLKNVDLHLKSNRYKRIRIGIGQSTTPEVNDYVLGKFSKQELTIITNAIDDASDALLYFIENVPYLDIQTRYNTQKD